MPTTFILSYGYKAPFLGWDHLRSEAGLEPVGLADSWWPMLAIVLTLGGALGAALLMVWRGSKLSTIADSSAGNRFSVWQRNLLRDISAGHQFHLPVDVPVIVRATTPSLDR